jgi:hypothetical protein
LFKIVRHEERPSGIPPSDVNDYTLLGQAAADIVEKRLQPSAEWWNDDTLDAHDRVERSPQ